MTSPTLFPSKRTLTELEAVIEGGLQTFVEVGEALLEIRNRRLYLEQGLSTFEKHCRERWKWTRRYVNYQIQAAEVVEHLGTKVPTPQHEAQARALAVLPRDEWRSTWLEAVNRNPDRQACE